MNLRGIPLRKFGDANFSISDSASNSSKLTELAADSAPVARNRVTANVVVDENELQEVQLESFTTDRIPFSFPNLSDTGDKKLNLLVVGWRVPEILQGIRKQGADDENCRGVFSVFVESSLASGRPFVEFNGQEPIHAILIIMRASDPTALKQTARELACIDPVFLARKRVVFCLAKQTDFRGDQRLTHGSKIELKELRAFCNTVGTMPHNIYFDQSESVAFGTKLIYNKIKRLLSHPC